MNEQTHFKEAFEKIPVPSEKLDDILSDTFNKPKKSKRMRNCTLKYVAIAGLIGMCMISSAYFSPAFAQFVTQIPVVGQAFEYFISQEKYYEAYESISSDIGLLEQSNGVDILIEQAFYDGNTVTLSYIIQSEKDLGKMPSFDKLPENISNGEYGSEFIEGVGHVGMMTLKLINVTNETAQVLWQPKAIHTDQGVIEGNWMFRFSLKALEGKHIDIQESVQVEGLTVELMEAIKTDVNLTIHYKQDIDPTFYDEYVYVEAELSAMDDLGNKYKVPYNGGSSTKNGDSGEDITWNATIHGLDPKATSITFYPFAHLSGSQKHNKRVEFEPIVVNIK